MSNIALVQSLYAAFAAGDVPALLAAFAPEVVWNEAENFPYADGNPYVGGQAIVEGVFARLATEWDGFAVHPEQFLDAGGTVVMLGRYRGTHLATGKAVDAQCVHVWRLVGGKVAHFQQYSDTLQFARVTGAVA
jgi:ketosteroid isomerase-like protein